MSLSYHHSGPVVSTSGGGDHSFIDNFAASINMTNRMFMEILREREYNMQEKLQCERNKAELAEREAAMWKNFRYHPYAMDQQTNSRFIAHRPNTRSSPQYHTSQSSYSDTTTTHITNMPISIEDELDAILNFTAQRVDDENMQNDQMQNDQSVECYPIIVEESSEILLSEAESYEIDQCGIYTLHHIAEETQIEVERELNTPPLPPMSPIHPTTPIIVEDPESNSSPPQQLQPTPVSVESNGDAEYCFKISFDSSLLTDVEKTVVKIRDFNVTIDKYYKMTNRFGICYKMPSDFIFLKIDDVSGRNTIEGSRVYSNTLYHSVKLTSCEAGAKTHRMSRVKIYSYTSDVTFKITNEDLFPGKKIHTLEKSTAVRHIYYIMNSKIYNQHFNKLSGEYQVEYIQYNTERCEANMPESPRPSFTKFHYYCESSIQHLLGRDICVNRCTLAMLNLLACSNGLKIDMNYSRGQSRSKDYNFDTIEQNILSETNRTAQKYVRIERS